MTLRELVTAFEGRTLARDARRRGAASSGE
jgi:hypothetical protein